MDDLRSARVRRPLARRRGLVLSPRRPDPRLASGLEATAQVVAFAAVGAPLSYLAAAANLPLQDHVFAAADRALDLDWRALLA